MKKYQTDSVHAAEQTPTTQPADEAVAALTDEELEQAAGGARGQKYNAYGNPKVFPYSACNDFFVCLYCGSTEQQSHRCNGLPLENLCHRCKHFSDGYCKCFQRQKA